MSTPWGKRTLRRESNCIIWFFLNIHIGNQQPLISRRKFTVFNRFWNYFKGFPSFNINYTNSAINHLTIEFSYHLKLFYFFQTFFFIYFYFSQKLKKTMNFLQEIWEWWLLMWIFRKPDKIPYYGTLVSCRTCGFRCQISIQTNKQTNKNHFLSDNWFRLVMVVRIISP